MKKRGGVLMVIGIIVAVLILIVVGAGIYFYNFHVFKEFRACVEERKDTGIPCVTREDCLDVFGVNLDKFAGSPEFVIETANRILNKVIYCEESCFFRNVRGIDLENGEFSELESCESGEEEVVLEIRGKEGLEILNWIKGKE